MTFDEFYELCWKDLPPIRRNMAGRIAVKKVFFDTLVEFDVEEIAKCRTSTDYQVYEETLLGRIKGRSAGGKRYGFAIAAFILWAIASAVIQWVVLWWLNHITERESFETMRKGLQA